MANIIAAANKAKDKSTSVFTTNGTLFESNADRRAWFIQNVGTAPVFIKYHNTGDTDASDSSFNAILHGGTTDSDGTGGSASSHSPILFTGEISVYSTDLKIVAYEL